MHRKYWILSIIIIQVFTCSRVFAGDLKGDLKSWKMDSFIGFDPVSDCSGETGDVSSVFLSTEAGFLKLRITFDDMVKRKSNMVVSDLFNNKEISILVSLENKTSKQQVFTTSFDIGGISGINETGEYLRTPNNNLLELFLPWEDNKPVRHEMNLEIKILLDSRVVDEFKGDGSGTKDGGNCAFVHHGNQGLTYTNVFYGNAGGLSGLDGSGFDEVLQVHEATDVQGNFHMSGTLMPAAEWHNPEFNDWLATLASQGLISMMTSALGQNIMPFATDEMNNWSVNTESQMVNHFYNYVPHVAWVPERVWLSQGYYPDAGVIDWIGDNWTQHGIWGVILDDWPHLNGYDNRKIHWMNNSSGVNLRVIPINNSFVGNMHYDANAAKAQIASMGQYNICVYGTDWEVAAEMNEHDGTFFLDNYESVLWYCHDNYPAITVWKLEDAITNPDFNGTGANLTNGTYGLLGGTGGYGGSNNSWYINWASTPSHSDFHSPQWNYGTVWSEAYNFLMSVNDNDLAQLGWYTLMINLHETGWHTSGQIADWEHRYSAHIKNASVYTQASRWADGQYIVTTACYFDDIDLDGTDELVMHNDKVFMVFESIGGKANWVFYKDGLGNAYSVVSSDMAYWSESEGDYNESSGNHFAALSDVSPNQQNSIYNIIIDNSFGDTVQATLNQWGVQKVFKLYTGENFLDVDYNFYDQTGYIKSGWSPDLLDILWSGKNHLERIWGSNGSYCGYRNSTSGATVALVLGNGGASQNSEFEGTLVKGDQISGTNEFKVRLYAGYTSVPTGTQVAELTALAMQNMDIFPPGLYSPAAQFSTNSAMLTFSEAVELTSAQNISNFSLQNFSHSYSILSAQRQSDWRKVKLTISGTFFPGDQGEVIVSNVSDLNGNFIGNDNTAILTIPNGITPHTIFIDGTNDFISPSERIATQTHNLYITWDNTNLYVGFYSFNLANGDFFVSIDTDQTPGSGATSDSWGRVDFSGNYLPEYQVAIEGGGNSMQVNHWAGTNWTYPGNGVIGSSYEGWSSNGMTEIAVPWTALGNPDGIALSVHLTQESNQVVTEVFPGLNPIGNHPVITYFYAFFEPYLNGPMPLDGMEPTQVNIVPNTSPQITSFYPVSPAQTLEPGSTLLFSVVASDAENDPVNYSWKLDGLTVSNSTSYLYAPTTGSIGNHILQIIVCDDVPVNDCDTITWNIEVSEDVIRLSLKIFLEGPFESSEMNTVLNQQNLLPLSQPYNISPWYYTGSELVSAIPGIDITDWVLIELRDAVDATSATSSTIISRKAAFVEKDGKVVGLDGSDILSFDTDITNQLFAVVRHRDHLAVMSATPLSQVGGIYTFDFSNAIIQAHGGENGYKMLAPGIYGMVNGDANADGNIDYIDIDTWRSEASQQNYFSSDFNFDSQVDNKDKNDDWHPNSGAVYQSQVPE
jgi:hypothetical protein